MIEAILNPPAPSNYAEFFKTLLSVSGVLFGLTFAGLLFILQNESKGSESIDLDR